MTTVLATTDDLPELRAALDRRRELGLDLYDEVWEGVYRIVNAPGPRHAAIQATLLAILEPLAEERGIVALGPANIGVPDDHRIPDACLVEPSVIGTSAWLERAELVVEILSPDDATFEKLDFYTAHGVRELLVADWRDRSVRVFALQEGQAERDRSEVLGMSTAELETEIDWPPLDG